MSGAENTSLPPAHLVAAGNGAAPARLPPRRRLFRKYAFLFIALVGAALLVNSGFDFWFSYEENKAALVRVQQEKADAAATRIEEFVGEIERQIGWTTHAQWASGPLDQRRQDYFRLLRQVPAITELSQLDEAGREQLKVSRLSMDVVGSGADFSKSPAFIEAKAHRIWFSPVYFRKESEPYMTLAMAREGRNAGVTVAEINLKLIWDVITALKIGQNGYAYVVDGRGRLIAHPDISLVLRDTDLSKLPQVAETLAPVLAPAPGSRGNTHAVTEAKNLAGRSVLTAHALIPPVGWRVFVEVPLSEALAPLYGEALRTLALLLFGLIAATLVALVIARRMTGPIQAIAAGAERIGAGEFERRIEIHTGDELEALAEQFNRMGADLQQSYAELEQRVADRTAELSESLDQQTATAEVLGVINASPGDLAPVFDAMLEKAFHLCDAKLGGLFTYDGKDFRAAALRGMPPALIEFFDEPLPALGVLTRIVRGEAIIQIADLAADEAYKSGPPARRVLVDLGGARTTVWVALRKEETLLGLISVYRQEVRPFTDKQIALLQNFAAQAVIAMENARLITETREALEQQTATAEVLGVINSSPGDLAPVFDAMLEKAMRLCEAAFGMLWTYDGTRYHAPAVHGAPPAFVDFVHQPQLPPFHPGSGLERMLRGEDLVIHQDMAAEEAYRVGDPLRRAIVDLGGARTAATVSLRKEQTFLGAFTVYRQEVRPFTDKQIALLQNFAAQAVIAMENARLITETREALEQQTATAEVLGVINSSPGDLAPVFDAILEKAHSLCDAPCGSLQIYDGENFRAVAARGMPEPFVAMLRRGYRVLPGSLRASLLDGEDAIQIPDAAELAARRPDDEVIQATVSEAGLRTMLFVPLRREGVFLGRIVAGRREVRPFTDKQIALLQNFAAQAVIAMENARLITETREALEQQTATAEVLGVINSSPGDLAPVFDAMLEKAMALCGAAFGALGVWRDERFEFVATCGSLSVDFLAGNPMSPPGSRAGYARIAQGEGYVQIADIATSKFYAAGDPMVRAAVDLGGARTTLTVPLAREGEVLGLLIFHRQEVRNFSDREIAVVRNFAAQAVIAMENARLITETREALEQQTATAEVLQVINSSPGDLAPVFEAVLEKALRLCDAAFGNLLSYDGELFDIVAAVHAEGRIADEQRHRPPFHPSSGSPLSPIVQGEDVQFVEDVRQIDSYRLDGPFREMVDSGGYRSVLNVALRKEGALVGVIGIFRTVVRPFSDKQIALLQNFAAQAVIAMENARLITETREALEQQTATAEVLGVINASPGDLAPVFDSMLEKAMRLCEAAFGGLTSYDGERFDNLATRGLSPELADIFRVPFIPEPGSFHYRLAHGEPLVHGDHFENPSLRSGQPQTQGVVELGGARTGLVIALQKENRLLGSFWFFRQEVRPFTDKQIALLQNFAAQAVIAMENARLITETREALDQQTATAEVLGVINSSPGDLAPVFDAMLEKAMRLCEAAFGIMNTFDGDRFQTVTLRGAPPKLAEFLLESKAPPPDPGSPPARIIAGENVVHLDDLAISESVRGPRGRAMVELGGARSYVTVSLRKDGRLMGTIAAYRNEVRPFTDKQIALLQNFGAQAVIAMENARLITETREALEQQTATAEVLSVINSSPGDLAPVFDAVLASIIRLCEAAHGHLLTYDGERFHGAAVYGATHFAEYWRQQGSFRPSKGNPLERLLHGERFVHVDDAREDDAYRDIPVYREVIDLGTVRTSLTVPLRKDGALLGAVRAYRQEVRPFTDKQIALVESFAAQAVIAMENARLITETREALEQQTATAEVLGVINSSPGDLAPVFDAMLDKALHLCEASVGNLITFDGEYFHFGAGRGPTEFNEWVRRHGPMQPAPGTTMARMRAGEEVVHIIDIADDDTYRAGNPVRRALVEIGGFRTFLGVALRRDDVLLGALQVYRQEVRPFTDKQIALLQNFAAQAVIAMENARLITETREALEQQTATAEVLGVINSSPGDLAPVFDAILEKAADLCGAAFGSLMTYDGEAFNLAAALNLSPEFAQQVSRVPVRPGGSYSRLVIGERLVHIADITDTEFYQSGAASRRALADLGGARTALWLALHKDDALLGAFVLYRREVRPFTDKQIALLQNFAAQAVIAMENARLLTETRERTRDLQESLEYQTATSDVLKVISRSVFDLDTVLQTVVATAIRLCRADTAIIYRNEGGEYRWAAGRLVVPEYEARERGISIRPGTGTVVGRAALEARTVQILDAWTDPLYEAKEDARVGGVRTMIGVPLLREGSPIGVIGLARMRVESFTEKQIELVSTFADQAVIAIENARLLGELRSRTDDLARSVEELRTLGEVAQEVSSSLDLRSVLVTILNRSVALGGADAGVIYRYSRAERAFHFVEAVGWSETRMRELHGLGVGESVTLMGEAIARRAPLQIPDLLERPSNPLRDAAVADGHRSVLIVPLVGADRVMGVTILQRRAAGEFPEATVRLMQTLASQSVLAIQNARLFREIAEKSEELRQASEHKSQFLANMSHELRTPLNAILGYAELMVDGIYGELTPRAMGVLERVQNNGRHLLALINDVLDLAKIEAGQLTLTLEDYAMPDVVRSVVSATESLANAKGLKFVADIVPGLPTGHGDARRLSQVLLNLVGNAVKFTDEGEVAIGAMAENGNFVLTVRDTGPGIAPGDQDKIFGEFQQVDNSNTRKKGGTGLGLAISKRMVEMQGGTITVDSVLGQGAIFRVTLPIRVDGVPELTGELMGAA